MSGELLEFVESVELVSLRGGIKARSDNLPEARPGVYGVVNLLNGKPYIGESKNVLGRGHGPDSSPSKLRNAIRKHGLENFAVIPLYYLDGFDKDHILAVETAHIIEHDSVASGYNILENYQARIKQRATMKKKFEDPAVLARHIANITTPEARSNLSSALTAYYADPAHREAARVAQASVAKEHAGSLRAAWARNPRGWITNGKVYRCHFLKDPIPEGFVTGRKGVRDPDDPKRGALT